MIVLISLVLFMALGFLFIIFGNERGLKVKTVSSRSLEKLLSRCSEGELPLEGSLLYEKTPLPYDQGSGTFYLCVDTDDPLWENGVITAAPGMEAVFGQSPSDSDKAQAVREDTAFPFYLISEGVYKKCYIKITSLPVIDITMTDAAPIGDDRLFDMRVIEPAAAGLKETSSLTLGRLRGNTSLTYEKKSLRLQLKKEKKGEYVSNKCDLLGMRKDDDWILNSLYADNTRLRDKLCMDLWQETGAVCNPFGLEMGTEGEYAEVLIDHGYAGLYLLTYPVDRKTVKTEKVSSSLSKGKENIERIYKKKYSAPLTAAFFEGPLQDPAMPFYRGGYVLKGDTVLADESEWQRLLELGRLYDGEDEGFADGIKELTDNENLMACWLFYQAIAGYDNENKNHYLVNKEQNGSLKTYFIPWDMNISFGCVYTENVYYCKESDEALESEVAFEPADRLFRLDQEASAVVSRLWEKWRSGPFDTDRLIERMDRMEEKLSSSGALKREIARWPAGNTSEDISYMKDFTRKRLDWVDGLVNK